jgi:hypothetical protein
VILIDRNDRVKQLPHPAGNNGVDTKSPSAIDMTLPVGFLIIFNKVKKAI